jgi:large subunit ribosomal protein L28
MGVVHQLGYRAAPAHEERLSAMAAVCELCGKSPSFGMSVSHSHRRTKRRWNPNIQRVRALVDGAPKRLNVCTSCIKANKVVKNVSGASSAPTSDR